MKRTAIALIFLCSGILILQTTQLRAWVAGVAIWSSMPVRYYVNPANTEGLSASAVTSAIQAAASVWPTQSAANVSFSSAGTTTISSAANDGVNTVMFRSDPNGSLGATTYSWWDGSNHLLDSDIVIWGSDFQFFTGTTGCINGLYLEDVLAHEFGHVLGLKHSAVTTATMYPMMPGLCLTDWRSLDPDDIAGIQSLYPPVTTSKLPAAPSSLSAAQNASNPTGSLVVSWSDNANNESGYRIERSVDGVTFGQIAQTGSNTRSYSDGGLAAGTKYFYRAYAFNSTGSSAYSNTASGQTSAIAKTNQTIAFAPIPGKTTSDPPFLLSATASSGLTVTFSAAGPCTVSANTVTITGAGSCTITAHQAGNASFNAAPDVSQAFAITSNLATIASVAYVGSDTTTQGSWKGKYGSDGYNVVNDKVSYPGYAQVASNALNYTWAASTADVRGLQKGTSATDRLAATWYGGTFSIDVNFTDGNAHQVAVYLLDWDTTTRVETLEVRDAINNTLLDTRNASGFHNGQYVVWNIRGHVSIRVTQTQGVNAVVSGLFFGGSAAAAAPSATAAAFVGSDTTTRGSWKGKYGSDGYNVINDAVSYPGYARVTPSGQLSYTWAATTTDVRGLQKVASTTDRLAATWYNDAFAIDLALTDGLTHRVALYVMDWDSTSRVETIEIRDAVTTALLNTQSVAGFNGGRYLIWNLTGHVTIKIVKTAGVNAIVSGLFFGQ